MRLQRLMDVADQIVASGFSSIDLSNKAPFTSTLNTYYLKRQLIVSTKITQRN